MLHSALQALGLDFTKTREGLRISTPSGPITLRDGKAEFYNSDCQNWVNKIKQTYSQKTVEKLAKRYKFTVVAKPGNKLILRRY
jgi:hypothetical protein